MNPRHPDLPPGLAGNAFTIATARGAGVGSDRLRRGDLERRVYGVRGPLGAADDLVGRCRLLAARLGPDVFFSHSTAARLLGVPVPRALERMTRVHVTIEAPARAPHAKGLIGHSRRVAPGDVIIHRTGLRVSAPPRLLCEMAGVLTLPELVVVADRLIHHRSPLCTLTELSDRLAFGDRISRSAVLRRVVELADPHSESPPETTWRVVLTEAGLPPTAANSWVTVGGRRFRIDLAYLPCKVAIEHQGAHHLDPAQRLRDMTRRSWLESAGWIVVELNADDLADPGGVVDRVRAALARARSRYLPEIG